MKKDDFIPDKLLAYENLKRNNDDTAILLKERYSLLEAIVRDKKKSIKNAPKGMLHVSTRGKYKAYYVRNDPSEKTGNYIKKSNLILTKRLAQKEYDSILISQIENEQKHINALLNESKILNNNLSDFNVNKSHLVTPLLLPDEEYIQNWQAVSYPRKSFDNCPNEYFTSRNEQVRSKSEAIIAETLIRKGVPFRYEYPINIGNITVNPDFYCLNVRKRKCIIFEHFGMMDNAEYIENVLRKIRSYEFNGYKLGEDFIFTMETSLTPISTKQIEKVIEDYLL